SAPLDFDATASVKGLKVGYVSAWMNESPATEVDRATLELIGKLGLVRTPVTIPNWPYDSLNTLLFAEAAAAFDERALLTQHDQRRGRVADAWPRLVREARFLSAVDFVQADRLRRK